MNGNATGRLEWGLQAGIVTALALLAVGWGLAPKVVPLAPSIILIACGVFWHLAVSRLQVAHPRAVAVSVVFGAFSALVFVPSILVEYFGVTVNNTTMSVAMFALWLAAGTIVAVLTGRVGAAVLSSTVSAQIASLASVITMLASYYVLRGSALQERFFRTEGTYEDFARSGLKDFGTFVVEDMFGGTFFHMVLGTLAGALLGLVCGVTVVSLKAFFTRRGDRLPNRRMEPTRR